MQGQIKKIIRERGNEEVVTRLIPSWAMNSQLIVLVKHGAHAVTTIQKRSAVHVVEMTKSAGLVHSRVAHSQWVLGEAEADASFDRIAQRVAVQIVQGLGRALHILELDETHRSVRLCAEAHTTVSNAAREQCSELVLGRVHWEVTNIERVAGWVLVTRVDRCAEGGRSKTGRSHARRSQGCSGDSVDRQSLEATVRHVVVVKERSIEATLSMSWDRLGQKSRSRNRRLCIHVQETFVETLRGGESNKAVVAERVGDRVGERSCDRSGKASRRVAQAPHRQWVNSHLKRVLTTQEGRRQIRLLLLLLEVGLMTTSKGLGKAEPSVVGCVDVRVKVVAARVVVGREEIAWQSWAGRHRVEGVIGCRSSEAVAVLKWVRQFAVIVIDPVEVAGDANGSWRHSGRVGTWSDSQFVGETSASVEVLLGHLGLEQGSLLGIDSTTAEDLDGLQSFLVRAELCEPNL